MFTGMIGICIWKLITRKDSLELIRFDGERKYYSLDEATLSLPQGVYTTFRTFFHNKVLNINDHLSRLEKSAELSGRKLGVNLSAIREGVRRAVEQCSEEGDTRVRVIVPLGEYYGLVYLLLERLEPLPRSLYENGAKLITCSIRRENPKAKLTNFIEEAKIIRDKLPPGINDALMVGDDGRIKEGLSSNFFAVLHGDIYTAEEGVLNGITRSIVIDEARKLGIIVRLDPIYINQLPKIDEAFITSSSRGVLPIAQVDDVVIGRQVPGEITRQLMDAYRKRLERDLEDL